MSDALVNYSELGITEREESKQISELTQAGDYLPQLRVYGSEAAIVKEQKFPMGHLGLYFAKDKVVDLGEQTDCLLIDWRPRASVMLGDEQPLNYYDETSENFINVKDKALTKPPEQNHMAGLEYLIYFPAVQKFGLFFMGNPTLRRESGNVKGFMGKAITLKIKLIKNKRFTWHGCECFACDAPFDVPSNEEIKTVHEDKFANPKDSIISVADDAEEERAR